MDVLGQWGATDGNAVPSPAPFRLIWLFWYDRRMAPLTPNTPLLPLPLATELPMSSSALPPLTWKPTPALFDEVVRLASM